MAETPAADETPVKQASAVKEAECEKTVDGKVGVRTTSKPVAKKTTPTLAKKPTKRAAVAQSRLATVKTAAAYQDDESAVAPLADPLADPFGEQAPPRSRRQQIDETLDETETATPSEEPETSSMPDELEAPPRPSQHTAAASPLAARRSVSQRCSAQPAEANEPRRHPHDLGCQLRTDKEVCRQDFLALKANVISRIDLDIAIAGAEGTDFPCECSPSGLSVFEPRNWSQTVYTWKASGLCHKPLYFEYVPLGALRSLVESGGATVPLGCPLLRHRTAAAVQDGHEPAQRMHLHTGLLPPRQLCTRA